MNKMDRYRHKFTIERKHTIEQWSQASTGIVEDEVYRFLHTIKGTAATIGLDQWSEVAELLEPQFAAKSTATIDWPTLQVQLQPLLSLLEGELAHERVAHQPLVLIVDHNRRYAQQLQQQLQQYGLYVDTMAKENDVLVQALFERRPDVVVMQIDRMYHTDLKLLKEIELYTKYHAVPILLMSEQNDAPLIWEAWRHSDGFWNKGGQVEELYIRIQRLIEHRQWTLQHSWVDQYTQLPNANFAHEELRRFHEEHQQTNMRYAVAFVRIEGLEQIQQSYGYAVGLQYVQATARFLETQINGLSRVCRYHHHYFLLILPHMSKSMAQIMLDQLVVRFPRYLIEQTSLKQPCQLAVQIGEPEQSSLSLQQYFEQLTNEFPQLHPLKTTNNNQATNVPAKVYRIAVIDDDPIIRGMLEQQLSDGLGDGVDIDLRTYEGGEPFFADEWHTKYERYLIIVDGVMPRMDGMEVLQRLRNMTHSEKYTIMMLTSRKSEQDVTTAIDRGANYYLKKPFGIEELLAWVKRLVQV